MGGRSAPRRHRVAAVGEIPPGGRKLVEIEGRSLGVFNVGGRFYALRNTCPHQGGPLCRGALLGLAASSGPGVFHYEREGEILRCPWHGWEFDIKTGQSWFDPAGTRVRTYAVTIESAGTRDASAADRVEAPYVVETYDVTIEQEQVVVHIRE